jgi:diguanylate cyclase (GGDEF)-like protein
MHLDIVTLVAAGSFVTALSGLLLMGAWTQMRGAPALLWWAAADYVLAIGVGLLTYGATAEAAWALTIGGGLSSISPALVWAGTRTFVHRPVRALPLVAGVVLWIVIGAASPVDTLQKSITIAGFGAWIVYLLAANWELWVARAEPLKARWPLIVLFSLYALVFFGGIYDVMFQRLPAANAVPPLDSWFGLIHFGTLVYAIATALFMVVMCKERLELGFIKAAQSDALTGIANRGAFFAGAERLLVRCRANGTPLSVIVFDLDRFKSINDTHGHAIGDRVLGLFVEAARSVLRPNDFFGRHGGEEFAVVLPGATIETAYVIAERIRHAFDESCRDVDGLQLYTTVSAGVAAASPSASFGDAMEAADRALYRAKNRGRNRVERADDGRPDETANIIRVA